MKDRKQARLAECGYGYEIWDVGGGRGIYVHFNLCTFNTHVHEPEKEVECETN